MSGEGMSRTADSAPGRASRVTGSLGAAGCVAIIGSVGLAVAEVTLLALEISPRLVGPGIPADLFAAAVGRAAVTHVLFWLPLMLVLGLGYAGLARRRPCPTAIPAMATIFAVLAGALVVSADLELAEQARGVRLAASGAAAALLGLATYAIASLIRRKAGQRWLNRLTHGLAALSALMMIGTGAAFVRSPMFGPANWRVRPAQATEAPNSAPHVLWIVLDTARADRMSCHGCDRPTTPFLNDWARHAVICDRAVSNGMWTVPAHASMFTGRSLREHGTCHRNLWLDDSFRTVAEVLAENGYATAAFSNNPLVAPGTNLLQGFESWRIVYHLRRLHRFSLDFLHEKWGLTPFLPWLDPDYGAALTNHLVAEWLDAHAEGPNFVFVNYMETHLPYRAPQRYRRLFMDQRQVDRSYDLRRRVHGSIVGRLDRDYNITGSDFLSAADRDVLRCQYDAAVRYLDDRVRELIDMFRQRGWLDHTLVLIASDHGEHLATHGMWGHRFLTYQDLAHVALLIREPGREHGVRLGTRVQLSDLYATVLNVTVGQFSLDDRPNGRDLAALAERGGEPRIAICECHGPAADTLEAFVGCTDPVALHRTSPQTAAIGERFKLISSADGQQELYDLLEDPAERQNLIDERLVEAQRLGRYIEQWRATTPPYVPRAPGEPAPSAQVLEALRSLGYVDGAE
jgi:arylsulfatase A-like enzyme/post-segregation antitoxin (ccd killing protein)